MLFNSYEFVFIFLPIVFILYFYLNSRHLTLPAKGLLVFASLFFYGWWNFYYLPIIIVSIIFNYKFGGMLAKTSISKQKNRKLMLCFGVASNLSLLGYFKYSDFLITNYNYLTGSNVELLNLTLPLAISFFTFQQIAYLVDSYRHETEEFDLLNYSLFVTFFPQLIAGPIVHHKEMMPQFTNQSHNCINYSNIARGLFVFSIGLFKKVVIADNVSLWVINDFSDIAALGLIEAWSSSIAYSLQLYFDFSGYTDMAIGGALLFNIKLPFNFNSPYKATDIQDFWRRWHMTLSRFLRDYVYIPLGGNRTGSLRVCSNLLITFVLGGIWHGAGWTFVLWGFLHGIALVIHRLWGTYGFRLNKIIAWLITFNFVNITWVFFRYEKWDDVAKILSGMFGLNGILIPNQMENKSGVDSATAVINMADYQDTIFLMINTILIMTICLITCLVFENSNQLRKKFKPDVFYLMFMVAITFIGLSLLGADSEFLYFNF